MKRPVVILALFLAACGGGQTSQPAVQQTASPPTASPSKSDAAAQLEAKTARFAPVDLAADISSLPENERQALKRLVQAGQVFDTLFLRRPKAIEYFARVLSKRLAGVTRAERIRRATTAIAVGSHAGLKCESLVAQSLAILLKRVTETEVIYIEARPGGEASKADVLNVASNDFDRDSGRWAPPNDRNRPTTLRIALPPDLETLRSGTRGGGLAAPPAPRKPGPRERSPASHHQRARGVTDIPCARRSNRVAPEC